jgi:hypothetical protein
MKGQPEVQKDGFIRVHYVAAGYEDFAFAEMRHWQWDHDHKALFICRPDGRIEIPREQILKVEVVYNTFVAQTIEDLEAFANGEHPNDPS